MKAILIVLGVVAFSVIMGMIMHPARRRRATRMRPALARKQFVDLLIREGHAPGIAGAVYDGLAEHFDARMAHVYPGDDLVADHLMDEDDLTDAIAGILGSLDRIFPPPQPVVDKVNGHHAHATPRYIAELAQETPASPETGGGGSL